MVGAENENGRKGRSMGAATFSTLAGSFRKAVFLILSVRITYFHAFIANAMAEFSFGMFGNVFFKLAPAQNV